MRIAQPRKKNLNPGVLNVNDAIKKALPPSEKQLITEEQINAECKSIGCIVFPNTTASVCHITMKDGTCLLGGHIFAQNEVFIQSIGQEKAVRDARMQVADILVKRANEKYKLKGEAKDGKKEI